MAAPIFVDNIVVAVLDVESSRKHNFGAEDMNALQLLCAYLSETYRQSQSLLKSKKIAEISTTIAKRVISIKDLGILLTEIGKVSLNVLDADLVGYYF